MNVPDMKRIYLLCFLVPAFLSTSVPTPPPSAKMFNNSVNVRTVLFKDSDTCRVCWSKHDLNLLIARRLVQDLIPRRIPKDFHAVLKYLTHIIELLKGKCNEKNMHTMLSAIYDAIGGYLHAVVIPVLNEAYYAGNVDFEVTSQLHSMLGLMMEYLGTNGNSWSPPCDMRKIPTKVAALPIKICKTQEACKAFVIPSLGQKRMNSSEEGDYCPDTSGQDSKIQIPYLDDNKYPSAIAVPLKDHPLYSLMSECSVNLIPKYYILAMRCLSSPNFSNKDVITFNKQLHRWLVTTVVPHLHETMRWYPGFGGVMRVIETMNQRGLASTEVIKLDSTAPKVPCLDISLGNTCVADGWPLWMIILIAVALGILLLMCCCIVHCCIFIYRRKRQGLSECEDENAKNPFINIYCGLKRRRGRKGKTRSVSSTASFEEETTETEEEE